MKKLEKVIFVIWLISLVALATMVGYYYGHYMKPLYKTRFIPVNRSIPVEWI